MNDRLHEFDALMNGLGGAGAHRARFLEAWQDSPAGFAALVAEALRYTPRAAVAEVLAGVLGGKQFVTSPHATNVQSRTWLVHVESPDGVKPYRFNTSAEAATFATKLGDVVYLSDADPRTRSIYVEVAA